MNGQKWTTKEDTYLRAWYPKLGPAKCSHKLNRTKNAVRCRAYALGIQNGVRKGFVPLAWVDPKFGGRAHDRAVQAAERDGVLARAKRRVEMYIVPEDWAETYAEKLGRELEADRQASSWLRTKEVAAEAGLHHGAITKLYRNGIGIGRHLRRVRTRMMTSSKEGRRWHPTDARAAIRAWRAAK